MISIRTAGPQDLEDLGRLRCALWPEGTAAEHRPELEAFFRRSTGGSMEIYVAETEMGSLLGLAEVSVRPFAEGCRTRRVGYLEGWYVEPGARGLGIGRSLVEAAESWARDRGCREFASDAVVENEASASAHRALGFEDAGLIRCFRKDL